MFSQKAKKSNSIKTAPRAPRSELGVVLGPQIFANVLGQMTTSVVHSNLADGLRNPREHLRIHHVLEVWGWRKQPLLGNHGENLLTPIVYQHLLKIL